MSRDVGVMGENSFRSMCTAAGFICQKSERDETGWDFNLEYKEIDVESASDLHKSAFDVKVQVKSSNNDSLSCQVKLSNLWLMSRSALPSYFAFLHFDGGYQPKRVFIKLVCNDLIEATLKKVHLKLSEDPNAKLNDVRVSIKFSEEDGVSFPFEENIKEKLMTCLGCEFEEYVLNKADFLSRVGYEGNCSLLRLGGLTEGDIEGLVDSSLGLSQGGVDVTVIEAVEKRFGIETPIKKLEESNTVRFEAVNVKPAISGKMSFYKDALSRRTEVEADLFIPPFIKFLPDKYHKFLFKSDFFEIEWFPNNGKGDFRINLDVEFLGVKKFKDALLVSNVLSGTGNIRVSFIAEEGDKFDLNLSANGGNGYECELRTLELVENLVHTFGESESIKISYSDLESQAPAVESFHELVKDCNVLQQVRLDRSLNKADENVVSIIYLSGCWIGNYFFGAFVLSTGQVEVDQGQEVLNVQSSRILDKFSFPMSGAKAENVLKKARELAITNDAISLVEAVDGTGLTIIIPDMTHLEEVEKE